MVPEARRRLLRQQNNSIHNNLQVLEHCEHSYWNNDCASQKETGDLRGCMKALVDGVAFTQRCVSLNTSYLDQARSSAVLV